MNVTPADLTAIAIAQFWQVTAVCLLVGVVTRLACRHRPHLAYLLWMLVVIKALTPPLWASPTGLFSWIKRDVVVQTAAQPVTKAAQPAAAAGALDREIRPADEIEFEPRALSRSARAARSRPAEHVEQTVAQQPKPAAQPWLSTAAALGIVWLLGACGFLLVVAIKWWRIRRHWLAQASTGDTAALQQAMAGLAAELNVRRPVRLVVSGAVDVPAVFGLWRPTVLLPLDLVRQMPAEALRPILAHELVHVRRGDLAASILQLAAQLLWWFHPLIWWANREVRRERERACDEEVVAGLGCRAGDYARSLLAVLETRTVRRSILPLPTIGMFGVTARRLEHIVRGAGRFHRRTPKGYYPIALAALAILLPGAGLKVAAQAPAKGESDAAVLGGQSESEKALARLKEVGADWALAGPGVDFPPGVRLTIYVGDKWNGTAADWKLLERIDDPAHVIVSVYTDRLDGLADVRFAQPLAEMILWIDSPERLGKIKKLPECRNLVVHEQNLTLADYRHLFQLARDVAGLTIEGDPASDDGSLSADDIAAEIAGTLKKLRGLTINVPLSAAGIRAVAKITGLTELGIVALTPDPADAEPMTEPLAGLGNLQKLAVRLNQIIVRSQDPREEARWQLIRRQAVPLGDALARIAGKLTSLENFDSQAPLDEKGLEALTANQNLQSLGLDLIEVDDRSLALIARLSALRRLVLRGPGKLTDDGLAPLAKLTGLVKLELPATRLTDAGLAHLAGLVDMRELALTEGEITGKGLAALGGWKSLVSLTLSDLPFNDDGCRVLPQFASLQLLGLTATKITDAGLESIAQLAELHELNIVGDGAITDAGLAHLAPLKHLRWVYASGTQVSSDGVAVLKKTIPGVEIHCQGVVGEYKFFVTDAFPGSDTAAPVAQAAAVEVADQKSVLEELSKHGARVQEGAGPRSPLSKTQIQFPKTWQGTADDWKLLGKLEHPEDVMLRVEDDQLPGLSQVQFARLLGGMTVVLDSPAVLAKIERLPACQTLHLADQGLKLADYRRLFGLLPDVVGLTLLAGTAADDPSGLADRVLAELPARMKHLASLTVNAPVSTAGLEAIGKLAGLKQLRIRTLAIKPADVASLARLVNLQQLDIGPGLVEVNRPDRRVEIAVGDAIATAVANIPALRVLIVETLMSGKGFQALGAAKKLVALAVELDRIGDREVAAAGQLTALNVLHLASNKGKLSDAGLAPLEKLTELFELVLPGRGIGDAGLPHLAPLSKLEALELDGGQFTGSGLAGLDRLKQLNYLKLAGSAVDDAGCRLLPKLFPQLSRLDLSQTRVTDGAMPSLGKLSELSQLNLASTKITDAGLPPLEPLKNLRELRVTSTAVTPAGVEPLQQAIPNLIVIDDSSPGANVFSFGTIDFQLQPQPAPPPAGEQPEKPVDEAPPAGGTKPGEESSAKPPTGQSPTGRQALDKLKELGAHWYEYPPGQNRVTHLGGPGGARLSITLPPDWSGRAEDWKLLEAIERPEHLLVLIETDQIEGLADVRPVRPLAGIRLDLASPLTLRGCPACQNLFLNERNLTFGDYQSLLAMLPPDIEELVLNGKPVEPTGESIKSPDRGPVGMNNDIVREIAARLKHLKRLAVWEPISADGLASLGKAGTLEELIIKVSSVEPADVEPLSRLMNLQYLWIAPSRAQTDTADRSAEIPLGNAIARVAATLPQFGTLDLDVVMGGEGLRALAPAKKLESLGLQGHQVTDAGLAALEPLKKLRELRLTGTTVTPAGIEPLKQAIPNLMVIDNGPPDRNVFSSGTIDFQPQPGPPPAGEQPAKPAAEAKPGEESSAKSPTGQSATGQQALDKLKEHGAGVYPSQPVAGSPDRDSSEERLRIAIADKWRGTAEDWKLLEAVDDPEHLVLLIFTDLLDGLADVHFASPLAEIELVVESSEQLAKIERLPACKELSVADQNLTQADYRKLISLVPDAEELHLDCREPRGELSGDELAELIAGGMKNLATLGCGAGVTGKGLAALSTLQRLDELRIRIAGVRPAEVQPLARFTHLRSLRIDSSGAYTKEHGDRASEAPLGDAIARIIAGMPSLRTVVVNVLMGDAGAVALSRAGQLQRLELAFEEVTDGRLAALGQLTTLRQLQLKGRGKISDVGLASLAGLARLTDLALPAEGLTDTGLAGLAPLAALETLKLTDGRFNGSGLTALDRLANLRRLELDGSAFDDVGCRLLPQLFSQLSALDLTRTKVTDKGLSSIARLSQLRELNLWETKITDKGLASLGQLSQLSKLNLWGTKITDAGLPSLKPLENLRELTVISTAVTPGGVRQLKAAIPKLEVSDDYSSLADIEEMPPSADDHEPAGAQPQEPANEAKPGEDSSAKPPAGESPAGQQALDKLKELGATWYLPQTLPGRPAGAASAFRLGISFGEDWKGTPEDWKLLEAVDDPAHLNLGLFTDRLEGLSQVELAAPLAQVILRISSVERLAKLERLPHCRRLILEEEFLMLADYRKLISLAPDVEELHLRVQNPRGIFSGDELAELVAGGMKKLKHLAFGELPVTGKGLSALSTLGELEELWLSIAGITPAEVQPLSQLTHLRWLFIATSGARTKEFRDRANEVPLGDAIASAVAGIQSLRAALINVLMGEAGVEAISRAEKLQLLDLAFEDATDARLATLGRLVRLRWLHLAGAGKISDAGLAALEKLARLTDLALPAEGLTDAGLARLAPLVALSNLELHGGQFAGSGLPTLDHLAKLRRLALDGSAFDDAGCRLLPQVLPRLAGLDLSRTKITDAGMASLGRLPRLGNLVLEETKITDAGLAELKSLRNLLLLRVSDTRVTRAGAENLMAAIPNLTVTGPTLISFAITGAIPELADDDEPAGGDN